MPRRALSATRTVDLLNFLAAHPDERLSYSALSRRLGINLASTHNLLMALTECGYLSRDPTDRTFSLGAALVAVGDAALRENPIVDEMRGEMRRLAKALGRGTLALVRAGSDALCIARAGARQARADRTQVGQRIPVMAPLASVFVAWAAPDEVEQWLVRGGAGPAEQERQREILALVRERGYSVALDVPARRRIGSLLGELADDPHSDALRARLLRAIEELGRHAYQRRDADGDVQTVSTITAPVFDRHGDVAAAVTVEVFDEAVDAAEVAQIGDRLMDATGSISRG